MKVEKILQEGEKINERQMIDLCGGTDAMTNNNDAVVTCNCQGTGDNANKGLWCSCKDDKNEGVTIQP
ncbi:hypothetical protein HQ47_01770 [Porphyromonas macacae]|uniref:Uncharacterized protein n=1 Tax=Porphyromonas macacae TaxID=28115 RepID=A0A0A2ECW3_9PORP|nr:hypothetical protein [Porphyromonas macacae]KGN75437.1 hypothetical protein HQ47_01770 [Porphyromonas macacae]